MPDELTAQTNAGGDPQTDSADLSAVQSLLSEVAPDTVAEEGGGEVKPEPVQKPITPEPKEGEKPGEVQTPPADGKESPKAATAPQVTPTPEVKTPPAPPKDEELEALQPPRGLSPKSAEHWNKLKGVASERFVKVKELEAQLAEASKLPKADPAIQERLTKAEQEAAQYRAIFQSQQAPEFVAKYDKPIGDNETAGFDLLNKHKLDEKSLETVKKMGLANVPEETMIKWIEAVKKVSLVDGKKLEDVYVKNKELSGDRDKALGDIRKAPQDFLAKEQEKQSTEFKTYTETMEKELQTVIKDVPWAKLQEIPKDASPEDKARIEEENKFYQDSVPRFQNALYPATAKDRVNNALTVCLAHKMAGDLGQMQKVAQHHQARADGLQAELDKIKAAGVTANRGGSVPDQKGKKPTVDLDTPDLDAIEQGLDAATSSR